MFNTRRNEDRQGIQKIIAIAKEQIRPPGITQSGGNAAGLYPAMESPLIMAPVDGGEDDPHHGESGVDEEGNPYYPFILGIDDQTNEYAYIVRGYPTRDYQN